MDEQRYTTGIEPQQARRGRGVSEALGFVFIFAIIMSTVGLVYASGLSGLTDARNAERVTNAERAFDVLGHNLEDLTQRNAPSRATEIKLAEARLYFGNSTVVNVSGHRVGAPDDNFSVESEVIPLVFESNRPTKIVYSNGAIIRQEDDGSVMNNRPNIVITDERAIVPIVKTRTQGPQSIGGTTTVLVRADRISATLVKVNATGRWDTWVNVTSSRSDSWKRFLADQDGTSCSASGDTVECNFETDRIAVTLFRVDLEIKT